MFRQTLLLACLIAFATSASAWYAIGERIDGDINIANKTYHSLETEYPTYHEINMLFYAGANTFTYARIEVGQQWTSLSIGGVENGFNTTVIINNTTQISLQATIYGFPPGEAPIDFVPMKITSNTITNNY